MEPVAGWSSGRWCGLACSHGLRHCDRGRCLSEQLAGGGAAGPGAGSREEGQASRGCSGDLTSCKPWSQAKALSPWTQMSGRELDVLARGRLMSLRGHGIRGPGHLPGTAHRSYRPSAGSPDVQGLPLCSGLGAMGPRPDTGAAAPAAGCLTKSAAPWGRAWPPGGGRGHVAAN